MFGALDGGEDYLREQEQDWMGYLEGDLPGIVV